MPSHEGQYIRFRDIKHLFEKQHANEEYLLHVGFSLYAQKTIRSSTHAPVSHLNLDDIVFHEIYTCTHDGGQVYKHQTQGPYKIPVDQKVIFVQYNTYENSDKYKYWEIWFEDTKNPGKYAITRTDDARPLLISSTEWNAKAGEPYVSPDPVKDG